jgi:hypothetical protein
LAVAALAALIVAGKPLRIGPLHSPRPPKAARAPEPLPPPAESATEAVEGFWKAIIAGKYQGATVYCPSLVDKYGSREQAARYLKEQFQANPPMVVRNVELSETIPDSLDLIVTYEVIRRTGSPLTGQAVVMDTRDPERGYVILSGI